jgi:hypothetical protein
VRLPTAMIAAPRSTTLVQSRSSQLPCVLPVWVLLLSLYSSFHLSPTAMCHPLTSPRGPRGSPFSHHPLISCRVYRALSTSVHHPKANSFSRLLPIYLNVFHHDSSPDSLYAITPTRPHVLRAGPHVRLSRYPVIPGGSARSHPNPEVLSWLGHYQSQEAVIEVVEGG